MAGARWIECYPARVLPAGLYECLKWYASDEQPPAAAPVCTSRDIFQARLDSTLRELARSGWADDETALLIAVLGEVGNNSFDHNLGQWPDAAGCWFGREPGLDPAIFWVADRGVGLLATLRRADSRLTTPEQAMEAAFLRVLSGRTPERRGNGLKFVRSVINDHERRGLLCRSGGAVGEMGGLLPVLAPAQDDLAGVTVPGVLVIVAWRPL